MTPRHIANTALVLFAAGLPACSSESGPRLPASLQPASSAVLNGTAGLPLPNQLSVRVLDAQGAGLGGQTVSWSVTGGGGSVSAPSSVSDAQGFAATSWTLGTTAGSNLASASLPASPAIPSVTFSATGAAGTPARLGFVVQPGTVLANAPMTPTVQVALQDAFNNQVTTASANVTLSLTAGTGTAGASLVGSVTAATVGGVASFSNLSVDRAGSGYTLTASTAGTANAVSAPFSAIPFTMTFINTAPSQVTLSFIGTPAPAPIPSGGSVTFSVNTGRPASVNYYATASGQTTSGTPVGLQVIWDYTFAPNPVAADTVSMYVASTLFYLRIRNNGFSTLGPVYVNYGLVNQTQDNILLPADGTNYNIGYYRAFTNTNVRAYQSPATGTYMFWNQGTHFTLPFTNNQTAALLNNSLVQVASGPLPHAPTLLEAMMAADPVPSTALRTAGHSHAGDAR